ncbi:MULTISPECIES: helix-turn-helix domain-containing protein [Aquitalea]|uniref:helix-turn-helix domain-containing protein n=1 Tax=Aquitalea TaxID=407217 RepID=UPI00135675E2|nr:MULTISPECIES: helix-turn-helix domain-containing protein [Aquitalea]
MEQDANGQPADLGVGSALKAERERAGMSLGEVADRLKLSIRQLEAIEHDDFQQLPGATFVRGFVRNYARFLRVDPEPLMARLEQHFPSAVNDVVNLVKHEHQAEPSGTAQTLSRVSSPAAAGSKAGKWLGLLALAVVVIAVAAWFAGRPDKPVAATSPTLQPMLTEQAASAAVGQSSTASVPLAEVEKPVVAAASVVSASVPAAVSPVVSKTAASAAVPAEQGSGRLTLSAHQAAWISVVDANGKKLQFGTLEAGASKELSGTPPFQLKIGNAAQVQLSFNGQAVDLTDKIRGTTAKIELK